MGSFRDFKSVQKDYKSGRDFKSGQTSQIGVRGVQVIEGITNRCRTLQSEIQNFS